MMGRRQDDRNANRWLVYFLALVVTGLVFWLIAVVFTYS